MNPTKMWGPNFLFAYAHKISTAAPPYCSLHPPQAALANVPHIVPRIPDAELVAPAAGLLDFLFKCVEFRGREKIGEGDIKAVANELDGEQLRIAAFAVKNIFDARRRQRAKRCQLVYADIPLATELKHAIFDRSDGVNSNSPLFRLA